jgi:hypothetical protein
MTNSLDFTPELAQLIKFAGRTATAIRMYSAYNPLGYENGFFQGRSVDPARSPVDLMFLADALHHFESIGIEIERAEPSRIVETCDYLLKIYMQYQVESTHDSHQSKPTFEFWAHLVNLGAVVEALTRIRNKASILLSHEGAAQ